MTTFLPMKKLGKKVRSCDFWYFKKFHQIHFVEVNDTVLCILCLKHKGKLLVDWNKEQMYTTVAPAAFDAREKLTKLSLLMKI